MFEKLEATEQKYEDISEKLTNPDIISDTKQYAALMKEYKSLTPLVEKFREYKRALTSISESEEMMKDADSEIRELAEIDYLAGKESAGKLTEELKVLLIPKDPDDDRSVIVEIRGGAGGEEANLFANSLFRMYNLYAEARRWKVEIVNANQTDLGGFKEVSFLIEGEGAYSRLKYESGVHRVQRVPETESQGRVHTSTVTVAVLPEADDVEIEIDEKDLKTDVFRASGAGGQHINKTESAVRITHIPSGIIVECQDERSQHKNKDKAMKVLRSKLYEAALNERNDKIASTRRSQVGTGDRSERIRTYNFPESRVSDHRIGLTLYKLEAILNGDLDEIIDALITAVQAEKLSSAEV
ncbi:MAG: peptide chain release factor 1 [Ruminococcus sp.]|jgi:peptide chain release factor 1|nr:peptide chain release factor 1 [Ruminococcus sp.]